MTTIVCMACRQEIRSIDQQLERRIEFRRKRDGGRHAVLLTGYICRSCADREVEQHRPSRPASEQTTLI